MTGFSEMLNTHPQKPSRHFDEVSEAISTIFQCAQFSVLCADACLGEEDVANLRECIRLNLDCADICNATGRLIARQAEPVPALWRATLEACIEACRASAAECAKHQDTHEHCRVTREACERAEQSCQALLQALPQGSAESRH